MSEGKYTANIYIISANIILLNKTSFAIIELVGANTVCKGGFVLFTFFYKGIGYLLKPIQKSEKNLLIRSAAFSILEALSSIIPFLCLYQIIKIIIAEGVQESLWIWSIVACGSIWINTIFHSISTRYSHIAAFEILYNIRKNMLVKYSKLPMGFMDENPLGKLKASVFDDIETLEQFYAHHIPDIIAGISISTTLFVIMAVHDIRIAFIMAIPIAIYLYCIKKLNIVQQKNFPMFFGASQNLNTAIVEYLSGMKEIRIFSHQEKSFDRLKQAAENYKSFTIKWFGDCRKLITLNSVIVTAMIAFVFPISGYLYIYGTITMESFLFSIFIALCFSGPLSKLAQYFDIFSINMETANRINNLLDRKEIVDAKVGSIPSTYTVTLSGVSFGYEEKVVLHNISFEAKQGEITALVGSSGSGKTTIVKLISRFWDIENGDITIGGINIKDIPLNALNDMISFVTQKITLFELSIADNIRVGKPSASMEEVIKVAKATQCHEFISKLPNGYHTVLGQETNLSGGEKQRISLARALIKNAPIILLDEATAYADPDNEANMQQAISQLLKGKTVLVIAHRLSSIVEANQIVLMDKGCIRCVGAHKDLLNDGLYASLWHALQTSSDWKIGKKEEQHDTHH